LVSGRKEAFVSSVLDFSIYYLWRRMLIGVYISTSVLLVRLPGVFDSTLVVALLLRVVVVLLFL
jgi:hypothetical protein